MVLLNMGLSGCTINSKTITAAVMVFEYDKGYSFL
ncbi:hypothetical protein SAMN05421813_10533 [Daejeonella rubra]|uniref:Uncharacterized protein n=1 Tax=Daejeonella rubra TaxID=990371 RepID=A0A1G9PZK7_9SPHI|nr:hypothetical protein SAMN05421813_10533 [Daejeonella rubra]